MTVLVLLCIVLGPASHMRMYELPSGILQSSRWWGRETDPHRESGEGRERPRRARLQRQVLSDCSLGQAGRQGDGGFPAASWGESTVLAAHREPGSQGSHPGTATSGASRDHTPGREVTTEPRDS